MNERRPGLLRWVLSPRMVVFPNAKINLGLNVVRKRADGYHDIETVMVPIPLHDVLEAVVDGSVPTGEVFYTRSGLVIDGDPEKDLTMRALRLVASGHQLPGLRLHLHKVIPMGAGLGGGSSDAAHTLMLLDELLGLELGTSRLQAMAAELGSDCPFFVERRSCFASGRGELLQPVSTNLHAHWLYLVHPGVHVSTADVYAGMEPTYRSIDLASMLNNGEPANWLGVLTNSMEGFVFAHHPEVGEIKQRLLSTGASYASMSGSGSAVYGIYDHRPLALEWPASHRSWILPLNT